MLFQGNHYNRKQGWAKGIKPKANPFRKTILPVTPMGRRFYKHHRRKLNR
ncbi:hypothetical protein SAMN05444167_1351 [Terriglobus roseus]|uniref:Uncharacterized protein n=1 Tax=Terriglobus roseus TaxID=392734 RepID=A0A1G7I8F1_9BACT|nr:hypothetical protein SAMN05444167_1351 [Terriglobus roseus]